MIRKRGAKVPGTSIATIRSTTNSIREALGIGGGISMVRFVEFVLPRALSDFELEVCDMSELGTDSARTYPDQNLIQLREDVYDQACDLDGTTTRRFGQHNFTIAHEVGHLFLHRGLGGLARNVAPTAVFEDAEWQADTFSAELLMPYDEVKQCRCVEEIEKKFLVSRQAASIRYEKVIIKGR